MNRSTLFALSLATVAVLLVSGRHAAGSDEATDGESAGRLFRTKCFRCHDASMTMRPVRAEAIDSLVAAMRAYDTTWIGNEQAATLARYMSEFHPHPNSQLP